MSQSAVITHMRGGNDSPRHRQATASCRVSLRGESETSAELTSIGTRTKNRTQDMAKSVLLRLIATCCALWLSSLAFGASEPPPISAFAALPSISSIRVSDDGHYLATIAGVHGQNVLFVSDLRQPGSAPKAVLREPDKTFHMKWCQWFGSSRILCGFRGIDVARATVVFPITRLVSLDPDGRNMRVLMENNIDDFSQYQDEIVSWHTAIPNTVLIEAAEDLVAGKTRAAMTGSGQLVGQTSSYGNPAVYELNVVTGATRLVERSRPPVYHYLADQQGVIRVGWGCCGSDGATISIQAHTGDDEVWRKLAQYEAFARTTALKPVSIDPEDSKRAYAFGVHDGRTALWSIDLTDREPPRLVFDHPLADVNRAYETGHGYLLGVSYDTDVPHHEYTDPQADAVIRGVGKALGNPFVSIVDRTPDGSLYVLAVRSDIDPGTYYLFSRSSGKLDALGTARDTLQGAKLARMQAISYPARDGTPIPGYLTVPAGARADHLPLVVMPHDGPVDRDRWQFQWLVQFLASRGYAVLQMNFRGSSGYGDDWLYAAHQDWAGLSYSDIVDGVQWAVKTVVADPARICILGQGFGGYEALLGATRDPDLFRCAASIGGLSDLSHYVFHREEYMGWGFARAELGSSREKLEAESPRRHVDVVRNPVLLVHGDRDENNEVAQSEEMASALKHAGKPYELVVIPGADHQMSRESDRMTMLGAIDKFLQANLGPGVVASP